MSTGVGLAFSDLGASAADLDRLRAFYDELYVSEFPDADERESLANIERYLQLKAAGWYGSSAYHVVLATLEGQLVGGAIADFLAEPGAGVMEFLVVGTPWRGRGIGARLLAHVESLLAADAQRAGGRPLEHVVAEMNDPFRMDPAADSLDPFARLLIWGRWGFRAADFPYVQPALSAAQAPVHHLLLAVKPLGASPGETVPASRLRVILHEYLRLAMRIERPAEHPDYRAMAAHLDARGDVPLIPLDRYLGRAPGSAVEVHEIAGPADPDLDAVLAVYARSFPPGPTAGPPERLRAAVAAGRQAGQDCVYHLTAVRPAPGAPVAGMASTFTVPGAGFGGYIALVPPLRGRGRLRSLLARLEEQMVRDRQDARGWYIECQPGSDERAIFARAGFREVSCAYRPPVVGAPAELGPRLSLMYRPFGRAYGPPEIAAPALLDALRRIWRAAYHVMEPDAHPGLADIVRDASEWPGARVPFR